MDLKELIQRAKDRDLDSQCELGKYYCNISDIRSVIEYGAQKCIDKCEGLKWLESAATSGHLESQRILGCTLLYGPSKLNLLTDFFSSFRVAQNTICKNEKDGILWLQRAISLGDMQSLYQLGCYQIDNQSTKSSIEEGEKKLIESSSNSHNSDYYYELGIRYSHYVQEYGFQPYKISKLRQNPEEAIRYFELAAETNQPNSRNFIYKLSLARKYFDGIGSYKNYERARHWFCESLKHSKDNPECLCHLGLLATQGTDEKNKKIADEYFLKLGESLLNGNYFTLVKDRAKFTNEIFFRYADGDGVLFSPEKAFFWAEQILLYLENHRNNEITMRTCTPNINLKDIATRFKAGNGVEKNEDFAQRFSSFT